MVNIVFILFYWNGYSWSTRDFL